MVVHELRARSHDWVLACGSHQGQRLTRRTQRPNGWQQPRPLAKNSKKPLQNGRRPWMDHTKEGLKPGCGQHPVNADLREAWIFARCATSSATALRVAASDIPSGSTGGAIYDRPQGAVQVQGRNPSLPDINEAPRRIPVPSPRPLGERGLAAAGLRLAQRVRAASAPDGHPWPSALVPRRGSDQVHRRRPGDVVVCSGRWRRPVPRLGVEALTGGSARSSAKK